MPLDDKAKEEIMKIFSQDPLKGISLTNLKTGNVEMAAICTSIWDKTIKKYLKKGFIPTKAYESNVDIINKWEIIRENIDYYTLEIKGLKDEIADYTQTLNMINTDPFYARVYANSKSMYEERKKKATSELSIAEKKLEDNKKEFPALDEKVAKFKDFAFLRENAYV